ncbi:ABC transporter ATP-binding protein [Pseudogemmobacter faecipullorum]|uniref:ABC transporter ATP-binding protein n=1 Tax=Pseudogemmobacter faecipullorum TaxID=2755041 RepID=A0ABS8CS59_9RHOB|nr:ABC transporter ATP-binding protein [Pseudogemmobacter faecipullorum]MCB5412227.1 ABC transporter ATP-binding protein [Pseudogemmobacter faecipullorum]
MASSLTLNGITKRHGAQTTLKGVSLDIRPGEFLTLVGPSGCGKSTLLRIIAGLMAQDEGSMAIDGQLIDALAPKARDIAMVFQSYALYPHMSVAKNISLPLEAQRLSLAGRMFGRLWPFSAATRREIAAEVDRVAAQVELGSLLSRLPAALSGGQRQRVAVARAMIRAPRIFLMDEPLSNLDARLRVQMREEISHLHRKLGATFVYVTHDQTEAMTMSSRVALMMGGEIVQCDTPAALYSNPQDLRVAQFIGSPGVNVIASDDLALWGPLGVRLAEAQITPMQFALRPEALRPGTGALTTRARIERREDLGHGQLLFCRQIDGNARLTLRSTAAELAQIDLSGGIIDISADPAQLMMFNAQGKRQLLKGLAPGAAVQRSAHV